MLKMAGKITNPNTMNAVGRINDQARRASRACMDFHLFLVATDMPLSFPDN
jgi:hypothetical protein